MSDGRHELICPQGHVFEVPSGDSVGEAVSCPECGEVLSDTEAGTASLHPDRPRRGLWDMMQKPHADESTASGQESEASAPADDPAATDDPVAADDRPRGLWALMSGQEEASNSTEVDGDPEINSAFDEPETNEARGDSGFLYGSESTDESDGEEFEEEDSYDDGLVEDDVVNDGWGIEDAELVV